MTQTGTAACTCDPNSAELDTHGRYFEEVPLKWHTALCATQHACWGSVASLLSGFHPDSRIFTKGLWMGGWGLFTVNSAQAALPESS